MSLVSGIQYSTEFKGRRNALINGNFDVWQRGTSHSTTGYGSADRWAMYFQGSTTQTFSQQVFTVGQADVPNNPTYYMRNAVTTGGLTTSLSECYQSIEDVRTFAGETVTISFWAKATATGKKLGIALYQGFGTGGSPSAAVYDETETIDLNTTWTKHTVTATLPSISGKTIGTNGDSQLALIFVADVGSSMSSYPTFQSTIGTQTVTYDLAQIQIEKGDTATDFERRSVGEELALCQRYYYYRNISGFTPISTFRSSSAGAVMSGEFLLHPTAMRTAPAITFSASTTVDFIPTGSATSVGTGTLTTNIVDSNRFNYYATRTGTNGQMYHAVASTSPTVYFDAEF